MSSFWEDDKLDLLFRGNISLCMMWHVWNVSATKFGQLGCDWSIGNTYHYTTLTQLYSLRNFLTTCSDYKNKTKLAELWLWSSGNTKWWGSCLAGDDFLLPHLGRGKLRKKRWYESWTKEGFYTNHWKEGKKLPKIFGSNCVENERKYRRKVILDMDDWIFWDIVSRHWYEKYKYNLYEWVMKLLS